MWRTGADPPRAADPLRIVRVAGKTACLPDSIYQLKGLKPEPGVRAPLAVLHLQRHAVIQVLAAVKNGNADQALVIDARVFFHVFENDAFCLEI